MVLNTMVVPALILRLIRVNCITVIVPSLVSILVLVLVLSFLPGGPLAYSSHPHVSREAISQAWLLPWLRQPTNRQVVSRPAVPPCVLALHSTKVTNSQVWV